MNKIKVNNEIRITSDNVNYILLTIKLKESDLRNIVEKYRDKVDWCWISARQNLSEDFIREFQDKVDWGEISSNQKLSEEFIREFCDKVDWVWISSNQNLSVEFKIEMKKYLDK